MFDTIVEGIEDDTLAYIQSFTSVMAKRGYHVIGGLIQKGAKGHKVKIFCTAPEGREDQIAHMKALATVLHGVATGKIPSEQGEAKELPLGEN